VRYTHSPRCLTIQLYPVVEWIVGALCALVLPILVQPDSWGTCLVLLGIGAIVGIGLSPMTTVTADKAQAILTIDRRYLFFPLRREYPFAEIADVQLVSWFSLGRALSTQRLRRGTYFRVVVVLTSGQVVPLPRIFSWDHRRHVQIAQRLGDFINVPRG
jgi:hypothetical protein